jgi:hypothetical protein
VPAAPATVVAPGAVEEAVAALRWDEAAEGPDDWPWLLSWLRSARARAAFLTVAGDEPPATLAARARAVLPSRFGDNVGRSRGQR